MASRRQRHPHHTFSRFRWFGGAFRADNAGKGRRHADAPFPSWGTSAAKSIYFPRSKRRISSRRLPSDLPILEVRAQYPDILLALMDDTIQHWELQSSHAREDLLRFADYNWSAFRQYGKPVHTLVLYGPEVVTTPESVLNGGGHVFRVTNIPLSQHDGEAVTARLRTKVARHEALDGVDRVDLALAALMRHTRPLAEVVWDLTPVVEALPTAERGDMMGTIVGLSYHYLQADTATAILEALRMSNVLEQLIGEGIEKDAWRGRVEEDRIEGELEGKACHSAQGSDRQIRRGAERVGAENRGGRGEKSWIS